MSGTFLRDYSGVLVETWHFKKVIDLLWSRGRPAILNYNRLTLKMVMLLVMVTVKRPLVLNLLRITPRAM